MNCGGRPTRIRRALRRLAKDRNYPLGFIVFSAAVVTIVLAFLIFPYRFVAFGRATINLVTGGRLFLDVSDTCVEQRPVNGANLRIDQCDGTIEPGHN